MFNVKHAVGVLVVSAAGLSTSIARADNHTLLVRFERSGQLCLSFAEKQRLQAELTAHPPEQGEAVRLLAYSDGMEMATPSREREPCVSVAVPPELRDHARIAAIRGLAYLEAAREVLPERFAGRPVFVVGADLGSLPAARPGIVTIVLLRSKGQEHHDRRVELSVVPPAHVPLPKEPQPELVAPPPIVPVQAKPPPPSSAPPVVITSPIRPLGWLAVTVGGAGAAVGAAFLGFAAYENTSASKTFNRNESAAMRAEGHSYARAGGITIGLGAALALGGIIVLQTSSAKPPTAGALRSLNISATGVGVQW